MSSITQAIGELHFGAFGRLPMVHQSELADCGLACLAMVSSYHGAHVDLIELRQRFSVSMKGMPLAGLIRAANAMGMAARPLRLELEALPQLKLPCVLHWNFNHYVVLRKIKGNRLYLHDPAIGARSVTLEEASASFTGYAVELWPNPGFAAKPRKPRVPLRAVLGQLHGWQRPFAIVIALALALEVIALLSPLFMQFVLDEVIPAHDQALLVLLAVMFCLLYLTQNLLSMMRSAVLLHANTLFSIQARANLFQHVLNLPVGFFLRRSLGDIASRFASVDVIQRTVTSAFIESVLDGLMAVATLVLMLLYSPQLAAISLSALALYIGGRLLWYWPLHSATEQQIVSAAKQNTHFLESLRGVRAVKLFARTEQRHASWLNLLVRQINADLRTQYLHMLYGSANNVLFTFETVLVIYLGAMAVLDGAMSAGVLLTFLTYKAQFGGRLTSLVNKYFDLKMLNLQLDRVSDFINEQPEPSSPPFDEATTPPCDASVQVRGLSFRYGEHEKEVLSDVSLNVAAGEFVAIAGPSGCGKSTLIQVILGVYRPTKGSVRIGGIDVATLGMRRLREMVGTVMQDDDLFAGTIAENISFFDEKVDMEWVADCARLAAVDEEIEAMPMKYHTFIGDMGSVLSGGQKQRILLARALYKRPTLLLLDEATSHLDVMRERQVNDAIAALRITRIIVAHRPDTLASADRVVQFKDLSNAAGAAAALMPANAQGQAA
ncbi:peptidase domain-containing ABC transporter [Pseudoduganella sp. HUAS MS19]